MAQRIFKQSNPEISGARVGVSVAVYLIATAALAILLAPQLFAAGRWLIGAGLGPWLKRFHFATYVNRAAIVAALLLLPILARGLDIRSFGDLTGWRKGQPWRSDLATGAVVGFVGLAVALTVFVSSGGAVLRANLTGGRLILVFITAIGSAVAVALIEEIFFRGALLGALRRAFSWPIAIGATSVFFSVVHFLRGDPAHRARDFAPTLSSSFEVVAGMFWRFDEPAEIWLPAFNLFAVGALLALTVKWTGSLAMAVGLHGGWVLALRGYQGCFQRLAEPGLLFGRPLVTGLAPLVLVIVSALLLWRIVAGRDARYPLDG